MNTIWNEWYYQDRFIGKKYPFIDNIPKFDEDIKTKEEKREPRRQNEKS